jgi:hypothetical protein
MVKMNKEEWLEENGFNENEETYLILGNSYQNRQMLKAQGCKYNPSLKWHSSKKIDNLPQDCWTTKMTFDELYIWRETDVNSTAIPRVDMQERIDAKQTVSGEFYGEEKKRFRNVTATYVSTSKNDGVYGTYFIHKFLIDGKYELEWITEKEIINAEGAVVELTGTVSAHLTKNYKRITKISRCKVE